MGMEATVKGQGVFGGGFGYCGTCVLACTRERGEDMGKKKRKKKAFVLNCLWKWCFGL